VAQVNVYTVHVTRGEKYWVVHVPEVERYTQARHLRKVDAMARDLIAVMTNAPLDSFELEVHIDMPDGVEGGRTRHVPISEAKGRLAELVRDSDDEDVVLLRHGRPAAVVMSARRYEALLEEIEDLRDRLSIHEREGLTMDLDKVGAELGLS
jgi:antitoxin StbD